MLEKSAPAFAFGENRARSLTSLSDPQIEQAARAVSALMGSDLRDATFVDIGPGSGVSSLAARRLGARVCSFDYETTGIR